MFSLTECADAGSASGVGGPGRVLMKERDQWMMAVQARLERASNAQDRSSVLEEAAVTEARELARTLTDDLGSLPTRYLLGWLHWYRYQALPKGRGQQDLQTAVTVLTPCFINGISDLPGPLLPLLADQAALAAEGLLALTQRSSDLELLSATTDLWRRILAVTPVNHSNHAMYLSILGSTLAIRFERTGTTGDLDAAITYLRDAVQATPADQTNRMAILSNFGLALWIRFKSTGTAGDLDAAISNLREAVQATPADHPDRASFLSNLANARLARFERTGTAGDIDAAISNLRDAVQATPTDHPDRALFLSNLGNALRIRFKSTGTAGDLDAAIQTGRQAVQATPADHPDRAMYLSNLGNALQNRFVRTGATEDLDAAITNLREAVEATPATHPKRIEYLSNLGAALRIRFERTGTAGDLDAAITYLREAVQATPADHPNRTAILYNLGFALLSRFVRTGPAGDLDAAITYLREAVQATPADHPNRIMYLSGLGAALRIRFARTGTAGDLDAAIQTAQQAVQATPADHPDSAGYLSNLGNALQARFERMGAEADVNAAIEAAQQAVQATPADHPNRAGYLSNLGNALQARFERMGAEADVNAAIEAAQQAVQATPADHPNRAICLSGLGNALQIRFARTGTAGDLDAAITYFREALQATPADHPNRTGILSNLGVSLQARFARTGTAEDLDAAIEAAQQAVQATPADHPDRAMYLSNLGNALQARFERTGRAGDLDAAFQRYMEAANVDVAAASARIRAGRAAASLAARADPGRAARLLEAAVLLLPEVAPQFLERGDQQYAISRFAGLAADAAALALSDPAVPEQQRPARALRLLEAARGVLLSQALSTRGDLSELRERHPELAVRFTELRDLLDRPSPVAGTDLADLHGDRRADVLRRTISDRRQADAEFTRLLARIRGLEGFGTFALPPSAEQLEAQAEQGAVVVFNISSHRSDAILLTSGGITSQRLPGLAQATVIDQVIAFYQALDTIAASGSPLDRANAQKTLRQVLAWLWDNAAGPVLYALGHRDQPLPGKPWPRLWWVPGGLLSLLPIHAAGHHTNPADPGLRTVIDRVISSYTPTIGALAHARTAHAAAVTGAARRSLIVAMPTTPDLPGGAELIYVPAEAALLRARLPRPTVLSEISAPRDAADQLPTKAAVLAHLPGCAIAHFACHGYTDPTDPSQSRLLLHDHRRDPLTVAALAPVALDHAQLAYLSACGTGRATDTRLLDEAIHLATAFQLAGFPHVIGTLWEIDDAIAVEIADTFYTSLANSDGTFHHHDAARALHQATRTQRDRRPVNPYLWASHIHAGA